MKLQDECIMYVKLIQTLHKHLDSNEAREKCTAELPLKAQPSPLPRATRGKTVARMYLGL